MEKQLTNTAKKNEAMAYRNTLRQFYNEMASKLENGACDTSLLKELDSMLDRSLKLKTPERESNFIRELCGKSSPIRLAA